MCREIRCDEKSENFCKCGIVYLLGLDSHPTRALGRRTSYPPLRVGTTYSSYFGRRRIVKLIMRCRNFKTIAMEVVARHRWRFRECLRLLYKLCSTNFTMEQLHKNLEFVKYVLSQLHPFSTN